MRKKKSAPPPKRAKKSAHKTRKPTTQREKSKTREQVKRAERRAFLKAERERLARREQRRLERERAARKAQREAKKRSAAAKRGWDTRRISKGVAVTKKLATKKRKRERAQRRAAGQWHTVFDQSTEGIPAFWLDAFDGMNGTRDDYANLGAGLHSALRGARGKIVDSRVTGKYTLDAITWDAFTVTAVNRFNDFREAARVLYLAPLRRIVKRDSLASYVVESFRVRLSAEKVPHIIPEAAMRKPKKKKRA